MALPPSALSELLDAFKAGDGVELIRDAVRLVLHELIESEAIEQVGGPLRTPRVAGDRTLRRQPLGEFANIVVSLGCGETKHVANRVNKNFVCERVVECDHRPAHQVVGMRVKCADEQWARRRQ